MEGLFFAIGFLKFQQLDGLNTALPIGVRKINAFRTLTTESLAVFIPFKVQEIQDKGGIYFGENAISHNLIMCNKANLLNQSAFYLGVPGAGKSFAVKELIAFLMLHPNYANDEILICDPEGEFGALVKALGREKATVAHLVAGGKDKLNSMYMVEGYGEQNPIVEKSQFVMSLIEQIDKRGVGPQHKSIIDRCTALVYPEAEKEGRAATLCDLRNKLLEQPEEKAKEIALSLELYTTGSLDIFGRDSTVDLNKPYVVFDIHGLGEQLKPAGSLVITDTILNRVTLNWKRGKRTHVFIDESSTAKGTVKTASKSIKTAEKTAKASIKTTQQAAKTAQKTAQATARAARAAAHAARVAAKAAVTAAKVAVKATIAAVKAIIAATKALIAAIAAGGWVAVLVIIVICLIGMIIGSCFGIFFSGEDSGTGQTMQTAVQEINAEYEEKLEEIKTSHTYDVLEMSGSRAVWKEVLAVYAVKTTTDPDAAQEVATMDDSKKQLLKDIFWQMNEISSSTSTKTETIIETSDDGHGNIVETEVTVTRTYLYITVSHKTAEEMANQFSFHEDQREQMAELLADENSSLWSQVLYGITGGDGEIVTVALSQVGNTGGAPYWSWYGFDSRVEWCACFVSWCANECGYIDAGVIPKFAACASQGVPWFKERGLWQDNSYEPRPGDIIFFDWDDGGQDGSSDHVGIVEKVENGRVYTVEGNSGDSVRQNSYPVGYYEIYGYGTPAY